MTTDTTRTPSWAQLLSQAVIVTFAAHAIPYWLIGISTFHPMISSLRHVFPIDLDILYDILCLLFAILLAAPTMRRSGLTPGRRPDSWWHVAVIVSVPIALAAAVYPNLPVRPFSH